LFINTLYPETLRDIPVVEHQGILPNMLSKAITADAPSTSASTSAELSQLYLNLSQQPGGGTIYLSSNFQANGEIRLSGGGDEPVHITSADPEARVEVARIYLDNVENVKLSALHVDSTDISVPSFQGDLDINDSSSIEISDITFKSDGTEYYDPRLGAASVNGGRMAMIDGSDNITVTDTVGSHYYNGWGVIESSNVTIENNELFAIQGDGIKLREVNDVLIKDNYLHDFAVSPNEVNHSDFIQMHSGGGADSPSTNVTVTGNVLDTGNGSSVQPIWMRNEAHNGNNDHMLYQNISITDNLIYTGSANGIGIGGASNVDISNNTLIWNPQAETIKATGNTSFEPSIRISEDVSSITVSNNIAPKYLFNSPVNDFGNITTSSTPNSPNFVGDHFVNVANGGDVGPEGWQLLEDSPFVGTGAAASQPNGLVPAPQPQPQPQPEPEDEMHEVSDDPPQNVSPPPPVIEVSPDNGASAPDPDPEPAPAPVPASAPQVGSQAMTLYASDFENGLMDLSDFDSDLRSGSERNIVDTPDGQGYQIGDGKMVRLDVANDQIHSLDSFGFEMEITLLDSDDTGRFLHFPRAFEASVGRDGTVTFELTTDQGIFMVDSGDVVLNDGATHLFAVGYDDAMGKLSMSIDGTVVGTTEASGSTAEGAWHGMTVGSIWGNSVDAVVDDIFFGNDPMEAGVDLSQDVGETFLPPPSPPIGGLVGPSDDAAPADPTDGADPVDVPVEYDFFTSLLMLDFEDGISDASDYDSGFRNADENGIVATDEGDNAYRIGEGDFVRMERDSEQIHELDSFGLSLDIQLLDATDTGRFIHFPRAFEAAIEDDRSVSFRLDTDAGTFRLNSGEVTLDDLEEHTFSVGYDGEAGQLTMAIDGQIVDSVAAHGETAPMAFHGLAVGTIWGDGVTALVDNVWLGEPAEDAETNPDAGLLHALIDSAVAAEIDPAETGAADTDTDVNDDALAA
jgi:hypothetical protein